LHKLFAPRASRALDTMRCSARVARRRIGSGSTAWTPTRAGKLGGVAVIGPTPGLVWVHSVGGCIAADEIRGVGDLLSPKQMGRSVLRLDLRGHGLSATAHEPARGSEQYVWTELAKDLRIASKASLSRAFFAGEGSGAAVALRAAAAAAGSGSLDAPPGLVLVRPIAALLAGADNHGAGSMGASCESMAEAAERGGWDAVEALEDSSAGGGPALDGGAILSYGSAAAAGSGDELRRGLREIRRRELSADVFAAALRGHAASGLKLGELQALGQERHVSMADDAYGVPLILQCPVLILAVQGDPEGDLLAAQQLAVALQDAELDVASDGAEAARTWPGKISAFLRKAWMKEFLAKRVMPQ